MTSTTSTTARPARKPRRLGPYDDPCRLGDAWYAAVKEERAACAAHDADGERRAAIRVAAFGLLWALARGEVLDTLDGPDCPTAVSLRLARYQAEDRACGEWPAPAPVPSDARKATVALPLVWPASASAPASAPAA